MTLPPVAFIDEPNCIGCALCLKVCPTDAIVGAARQLHTVIAADCTGCDRCLPVCPTDCITLQPRTGERAAPKAVAARWRLRVQGRRERLARAAAEAAAARARQRAQLRRPGP
jgi:Na+-translocating ferredoxin:NAD+ oxidoreductase subunit B